MPIGVFDCHADTPVELWRKKQGLRAHDGNISLEKAKRLAHYAQFFAYCTYGGASWRPLPCEDFYTLPKAYMDEQLKIEAETMQFCTTADEVEAAWSCGKMAALYSLEGAEGIGCDSGRLDQLFADGVRMTTLTWNGDNALAGCHMGEQIGLSAAGREFVRRAQKLGIVIDVSHCSDRTFFNLLDITEAPIIASHSNSRAVCNHSRNLTDEMYRLICQTDGVAGINLYADFLSEENATFDTVYAHIDHFLELGGEDHLALGGDLDGCERLPEGFANVGSYADLEAYLLSKYPTKTVEKLFNRNIMRVLRRCER